MTAETLQRHKLGVACKKCGADSWFFERGTGYRKCSPCRKHIDRKNKHGIEREAFEKMVAMQHGCCAICGRPDNLHVDHHHESGQIRQLLCTACNHGLGHFQEDPERLLAAVSYINRHERKREKQS